MLKLVIASLAVLFAISDAADKCAPVCDSTNSLYPHPKYCDKFYQCSFGTPYLMSCPAGLQFSPTGLRCDYAAQAGCRSDPSIDCSPKHTTPKPVNPTVPTTHKPHGNSTVDTCFPPCPSPDVLFPHPHDCTKYFHCSKNVPFLRSCPPAQEYSLELVRCDWPERAKCTADPSKPCVAVTNPPKPTTEKPDSPVSPDCAPKCPWPNAYMPHPQDCTKFYICGGMIPYVSDCQPGLEYSAERVRCDWPNEANCKAGPAHACDELLRP